MSGCLLFRKMSCGDTRCDSTKLFKLLYFWFGPTFNNTYNFCLFIHNYCLCLKSGFDLNDFPPIGAIRGVKTKLMDSSGNFIKE